MVRCLVGGQQSTSELDTGVFSVFINDLDDFGEYPQQI